MINRTNRKFVISHDEFDVIDVIKIINQKIIYKNDVTYGINHCRATNKLRINSFIHTIN